MAAWENSKLQVAPMFHRATDLSALRHHGRGAEQFLKLPWADESCLFLTFARGLGILRCRHKASFVNTKKGALQLR